MSTLSSILKLSLIDGVSGKARGINSALSGINKSVSTLTSPLRSLTGQMIGMGIGAVGVGAVLKTSYTAAADMQAALSEIGIKSNLSAVQLGQMQQRLTALSPKVNQFTSDLTAGVDVMTTMGLSADMAMGAIPAIGKAATATGASITDLSGASVSAMQNLKVLPGEIGKALDGMAYAGNAGAFEIKDMAQYVPTLGAAYQGLGQKGVGSLNDLASALQIVRKGTGDSSSAATNLSNLLQKINAPQTTKAFKSMGVNLSKELSKASKKGLTPIEAIAEITNKTLKGNLGQIGDLFQDAQVQQALRPLIQNIEEYRKIRDGANAANGTIDTAYARRMQDNAQKTKAFQVSIENLKTAAGSKLLTPIGKLADDISYSLNTLDQRFSVFDRMKASIEGLLVGSGAGNLDSFSKKLNDFVFGVQDGGKAADKYGAAFKQFYEYGQDVKSFTDALDASPVAKFMTELGLALAGMSMSKYFKLFAIAAGVKAVVDAAKDAKSISEFVDNLKGLSALEWAGIGAGLLMVASRTSKVIGLFRKAKAVAPVVAGAETAAGAESGGILAAVWKLLPAPVKVAALGAMQSGSDGHSAYMQSSPEDRQKSRDEARAIYEAHQADAAKAETAPPTVFRSMAMIQSALAQQKSGGGGPIDTQPGNATPITASSIASAIGGQQLAVRVTNPPPPVNAPVTMTNNFVINGVSDPKAAADAAAQKFGAVLRAQRQSAFTDEN